MKDVLAPDTSDLGEGLAALVIGLADVVRLVMEHQAINQMRAGNLSDEEVERLGNALQKLSTEMASIKQKFGMDPDEEITLSLGEVDGHAIDVKSILDNLIDKGVILSADLQLMFADVDLASLALTLSLAPSRRIDPTA